VEKTRAASIADLREPIFAMASEKSLRLRTMTDWLNVERVVNIELP
jgi:hypothetical protein